MYHTTAETVKFFRDKEKNGLLPALRSEIEAIPRQNLPLSALDKLERFTLGEMGSACPFARRNAARLVPSCGARKTVREHYRVLSFRFSTAATPRPPFLRFAAVGLVPIQVLSFYTKKEYRLLWLSF